MSQLVVRPGRNAAREAKRIKEIRKVKGAIQWHERERKKRQEIAQERWDSKQAVLQHIKWENEHVKGVRKTVLRNAKEDWQLGPLRPNRAFGEVADKYGAMTAGQVQKPEIPVHTQQNRNEYREKKGLQLEYPLVVDKEKYFPIVKGDRVVILKGKDKGKIGVVEDVVDRTHELVVKGLNMQYFDSDVFGASSEQLGPKQANEVPIPLADLRLIVPYEITQRGVRRYSDVIVENIFMERHTKGIDPYTGFDYGNETIPEQHQYDPQSGLPIFHRYIAGTQHRIEWPWERDEEAAEPSSSPGASVNKGNGILRKTMNTLRHPITSLKSLRGKKKVNNPGKRLEKTARAIERFERKEAEKLKQRPRSVDPKLQEAYDNVDTTRNIVEGAESMSYTLIAPPFPNSLGEELRSNIHDISLETKKDKDAPRNMKVTRTTAQSALVKDIATQRRLAAERMKTPMQLRWEQEHAKKLQKQKKEPLVQADALLMALGGHMQKSQMNSRARKQAAEELD